LLYTIIATHYHSRMTIKTFKDKVTAATFLGLPVKSLPPDLRKRTRAN